MMYSEKVTLEREHPDYVNPRKVYVNVVAEFTSDGRLIPYRIEWTDGRKYMIDRVKPASVICVRCADREWNSIMRRITAGLCAGNFREMPEPPEGKAPDHMWFRISSR